MPNDDHVTSISINLLFLSQSDSLNLLHFFRLSHKYIQNIHNIANFKMWSTEKNSVFFFSSNSHFYWIFRILKQEKYVGFFSPFKYVSIKGKRCLYLFNEPNKNEFILQLLHFRWINVVSQRVSVNS